MPPRCGKYAYRSAREAWRAARARLRFRALEAYRCSVCHRWHLKSKIDRTARRRSWGWRRRREERLHDE